MFSDFETATPAPRKLRIGAGNFLDKMLCMDHRWDHRLQYVNIVDSHIQRIVLATEETMATQQVNHRPIKCQSRLWSQRGTKVNGSPRHGDKPLLRPTRIHLATKSYATLQAMHRPMPKRLVKLLYSIEISRATSIDLDRQDCCPLPTTNVLSNKEDKLRSNQF